jgi:hypothetical protein
MTQQKTNDIHADALRRKALRRYGELLGGRYGRLHEQLQLWTWEHHNPDDGSRNHARERRLVAAGLHQDKMDFMDKGANRPDVYQFFSLGSIKAIAYDQS